MHWFCLVLALHCIAEVWKVWPSVLSCMEWSNFTEEVVVNDKLNKTEAELGDLNGGGVWDHWGPYWFICGICSDEIEKNIILKTKTLHQELYFISDLLTLPNMRGYRGDDKISEGGGSKD